MQENIKKYSNLLFVFLFFLVVVSAVLLILLRSNQIGKSPIQNNNNYETVIITNNDPLSYLSIQSEVRKNFIRSYFQNSLFNNIDAIEIVLQPNKTSIENRSLSWDGNTIYLAYGQYLRGRNLIISVYINYYEFEKYNHTNKSIANEIEHLVYDSIFTFIHNNQQIQGNTNQDTLVRQKALNFFEEIKFEDPSPLFTLNTQ